VKGTAREAPVPSFSDKEVKCFIPMSRWWIMLEFVDTQALAPASDSEMGCSGWSEPQEGHVPKTRESDVESLRYRQ